MRVVSQIKFFVVYAITQIQAQSPENKLIQILGNCLKVFIGCLERFIRFLGHLAYIETAIYGTNFCRSLIKAFKRLIKNAIRFAFVTLFSKLVIMLGKVLVIIGSLWLVLFIHNSGLKFTPEAGVDGGAWFSFADRDPALDASHQVPLAPIILSGLASGIVAFAVMGVYETAIDTIMVCFLEDEAENDDKGAGRHRYCNEPLAAASPAPLVR